ncbi:MAG TPA: hypothetical protein DEA08_02745 [Planctomycetes bacterium]|nr:hypothetical protein [Planctomycetota bacterium]
MVRALVLALLVLASGCTSTLDVIDEGLAIEREAKTLQSRERFGEAATTYGKASTKFSEAHALSLEEGQPVFTSFLNAKLSIVARSQAECTRPDANESGSWEDSRLLYVDSAAFASRGGFVKMQYLGLSGQAECIRPDKNPKGDWAKAGELYAKAAELARSIDDDEGRGELLRLQVFCAVEGDWKRKLDPENQRLLERSAWLGDETSADLLGLDLGTMPRKEKKDRTLSGPGVRPSPGDPNAQKGPQPAGRGLQGDPRGN